MSKLLNRLHRFITDPRIRFSYLSSMGFYNHMDDEKFLKRKFRLELGYPLNLEHPKMFNEKLQWLKLYDRKPEYTMMVDKYKVRMYIAETIGEKYLIPLLGVWDNPDEINFDALPDKFVLKCNHNSGLGMCICRDKSKLDIDKVKKELKKGLKQNYYLTGREWPYKNVSRKIIAEEYLEDSGRLVPEDYKVYCFGGKPKYIVVFHDRFDKDKKPSETVYDTGWNPMNISLDEHFMISNIVEPKPECLEEILSCAEKLSAGMAQSRIDFYIVDNVAKFGEITLHTASGMASMIPKSLDDELGKYIHLPWGV